MTKPKVFAVVLFGYLPPSRQLRQRQWHWHSQSFYSMPSSIRCMGGRRPKSSMKEKDLCILTFHGLPVSYLERYSTVGQEAVYVGFFTLFSLKHMQDDMKLLCGDDDDRLVAYFPSCSNSIPGENGNFLHWKFSKGANKISNSISCGGGGRNGPEAAPQQKLFLHLYHLHVFRPQTTDMNQIIWRVYRVVCKIL